jgi:hypothetical protein
MTDTLKTHAVAIARTFGTDSAAIAARVTVLYAAHSDGITGNKSIAELAAAATDARIAAANPGLSVGEYGDYRTDDRYRVGKSTLAMYSLAASVVRDMGLAPSDLSDSAVHAVFRTTANRAGVAEYRRDAVAAVVAAPATERPAMVFPLFDAAYTLFREDQKTPPPNGGPDGTEDTTPPADPEDVERNATADMVAAVPMSADVIIATLTRAIDDAAALSDADALRVFDALDTAMRPLYQRADSLTGATV